MIYGVTETVPLRREIILLFVWSSRCWWLIGITSNAFIPWDVKTWGLHCLSDFDIYVRWYSGGYQSRILNGITEISPQSPYITRGPPVRIKRPRQELLGWQSSITMNANYHVHLMKASCAVVKQANAKETRRNVLHLLEWFSVEGMK